MPQPNDKLREKMKEQSERVKTGGGLHLLDYPVYSRKSRRSAAKDYAKEHHKHIRTGHSLSRRYSILNGHFIQKENTE